VATRHTRNVAFTTALLYALLGTAWIVLSDRALLLLGLDAPAVQTLKGIGFVLVTTVGLYLLLRFYVQRAVSSFQRAAEAESEYRTLFQANPHAMWVYDLETLRFLAVNDVAVDRYGYSAEEFLSMRITDIRPAQDIPALLDNIERVGEDVDFAGIWHHVTRSGELLDVEITSHVIDWRGHRAELVLADDVTARVRAERNARTTGEQFATIVRTSPFPIVMLDFDGRVSLWNAAAEAAFGWTAEEILGNPLPIVPEPMVDEHRAAFERVVRGERDVTVETVRQTKDGRLIDVIVHTTLAYAQDGTSHGALAIIEDVTDRKNTEAELRVYREHLEELVESRTRELNLANERLSRATRIKSEFLANMSHELRTPLNSIIGFSGVLLQGLAGDLTEEQTKQVSMVYRAGKHLLDLINDILDLSRIEAGRASVVVGDFDVGELVGSVVESLRPECEVKGLGLALDVSGLPVRALTDRTKVNQIVLNLVGNAVKFTEQGRVDVSVRQTGDLFEVIVSDTGPGVPEDERSAIFEEFTQARRKADEKPAGTGLGLAISRKLARMLGGEIEVDSEPGSGSTFRASLPLVYVERRSVDDEPTVGRPE
jgi:PAS domain S-box-containing protein